MIALRKDALMRRALRGADVLTLPALVRAARATPRGTLRARRHAAASVARKATPAPAPQGFDAWRRDIERKLRAYDRKSPPFTGAAAAKERAALLARCGPPEATAYGEIYTDGTTEFLAYNGAAKIETALERVNGIRTRHAKETGVAAGIPVAPGRFTSPGDHEEHAKMLDILEREHAHVEVRGGLLVRIPCPADCTRKAAA